ncbi:hypothetical protein CLV56_1143 [Mumia flava]|uniref:Uncharacterized protein n=1 Tax=Mumia flava TaxID=1348852 RepID=A0A0B2BS41_9ACTN|nr:hypothetical protein [Mumia flava]PJJ56926.1 hypothetical protein CLV56_1143 [Mumia flava]
MATVEEPSAGSHRVAAWTVTAVSALVLAFLAGFQVMRESPRDLTIFTGATLLVVVGAVLRRPRVAVPRRLLRLAARRSPLAVGIAVGLVVVAVLVLVLAPRESLAIELVAGAIGLVVLLVAWGARDDLPGALDARAPGRVRPYRRAATAWVVLVAAFGAWQLVAYEPGPTVSDILDPMADAPVGRVVFVVVWLLGLGGFAWHALRGGGSAGRWPR